jgi:DNA-binding PadR family transcriptional regulator
MIRNRRPSKLMIALLRALSDRQWHHGYDLMKETSLLSGTLYPLLMRMTDQGLVEAEWREPVQPGRPARHAYRLTAKGYADAGACAWRTSSQGRRDMMMASSRALTLACQCLGKPGVNGRRRCGRSSISPEDGRGLSFATGCLIGALRQMPMAQEGRFVLTNYTLAIAVIPIAAMAALACRICSAARVDRVPAWPSQKLIIGGAYRVVAPSLSLLLLSEGHSCVSPG